MELLDDDCDGLALSYARISASLAVLGSGGGGGFGLSELASFALRSLMNASASSRVGGGNFGGLGFGCSSSGGFGAGGFGFG